MSPFVCFFCRRVKIPQNSKNAENFGNQNLKSFNRAAAKNSPRKSDCRSLASRTFVISRQQCSCSNGQLFLSRLSHRLQADFVVKSRSSFLPHSGKDWFTGKIEQPSLLPLPDVSVQKALFGKMLLDILLLLFFDHTAELQGCSSEKKTAWSTVFLQVATGAFALLSFVLVLLYSSVFVEFKMSPIAPPSHKKASLDIKGQFGLPFAAEIAHKKSRKSGKRDNTTSDSTASCHPQTKISSVQSAADLSSLRLVYIKTRKTGSSTITNILYRFALRHNLTVMTFLHNYPRMREQFPMHQLWFLEHQPKPDFNLIMEHLYYDRKFLDGLMPGKKLYISSLRHPFSLLKSDIYYQSNKLFRGKNRNKNFGEKLNKILASRDKLIIGQEYLKIPKLNLTDSGPDSLGIFQNSLEKFSKEFMLIVITEHMDASLILLKRQLSWNLQDILYSPLKRGAYKKAHKGEEEHLGRHQSLKSEEYLLFHHFNHTLWKLIAQQSSDFWKELKHFKETNQKVEKFCKKFYNTVQKDPSYTSRLLSQRNTFIVESSLWNVEFFVDALDCILMKVRKDTFLNINAHRNFPKLCKKSLLKSMPKRWRRHTALQALLDPVYCSPLVTRYRLPVKALSQKKSFDWDDYFRKKPSWSKRFS